MQGKAKIVVMWVGFTRADSRVGHKRLGFKHSEDQSGELQSTEGDLYTERNQGEGS